MRRAFSEKSKSCFFVIVFVCGCSSKPTPEPIHVGEDVCANCRMAIIEPQFASEIILFSGDVLKFDDLACLAARSKSTETPVMQNIFVHDYLTGEWINGEKAVIARSSTVQTPMGSGTVAFTSREQADKFLAENSGQLVTLQEFLKQ